jgi:hypothetical protein
MVNKPSIQMGWRVLGSDEAVSQFGCPFGEKPAETHSLLAGQQQIQQEGLFESLACGMVNVKRNTLSCDRAPIAELHGCPRYHS